MSNSKRLTTPSELVAQGLVTAASLATLERVAERYAVSVLPAIARRIDRDDPMDPLARQFVPSAAELELAPEEASDPIGDAVHSPLPGIVHRYPDRVLLKPTHVCPTYCRFCFRRESVGPSGPTLRSAELDAALAYIEARPRIFEVILSGGDPLVLSPRRLQQILSRLDAIAHLGALRIHTRVPVVDPDRVCDALLAALRTRKALWVVVHTNHVRELDDRAVAACAKLSDAGVPLLAQSVLLAGVNDSAQDLEALYRQLVRMRIKPYYLHHADLAPGTRHFRVSLEHGRELLRELRGNVSGLCQPTYVLDLPGGYGKVPVGPMHVRPGERSGEWIVEDRMGHAHVYPPRTAERS